jgi:ribosomal-protein-alanine N-acetyltransferase
MEDAADAFRGWFSDPEAAMYMRWEAHSDISQTRDFIARVVADYEKLDFYRWTIALKKDNKAIGAIGLHIESEYDSVADVSYTLSKAFRNQGIVSEALKAVVQYAFVEVGVNRIEAFHAVANPASGKVMLNAGMRYEGHALQKYKSHKGFEDCDLYAAVAENWQKTSAHTPYYPDNEVYVKSFWSAVDSLIAQSEIVIDRLMGTKHPRHDFMYPLDYGYLKDTTSPDGGGIDVCAGVFLKPNVMLSFAQLTCSKRIRKSRY